jgi:hypothetical protein
VVAVKGAVPGVTWGYDPALDVTGTVPAVIAVAGCHSPCRRADSPSHHWVARPRNARLRDQSYDRSELHVSLRSPEPIPAALLSVASLVTCLARP